MHTATVIFAFAVLAAGAMANNLGPGPTRRPTPTPKEWADERAAHLATHEQVTSAHLSALAAARAQRAKSGPVDLDGPSPQGPGGRRANRLNNGEYIPGAAYKSAYAVADKLTGDRKSAAVVHEGDVTKGSYSTVDPDGVTRTVNYIVTPLGGFQAQVLRDGVPVVVGADAGYGAAPQGVPRVNHGGNQGRPQGAPRPASAPRPRPQQGQWQQAPAQPQWQAPAPAQPQWQAPAQPQWQAPAQPQWQASAPVQPQWQAPAPVQDWQGQRWQQPSEVTWTREVNQNYERERSEHLAEHARVTAERLQALSQANARATADEEYGLIDAKLYG